MFIAALFTNAKIWKQPKCSSIGEWIKKMCTHTHTHTHTHIHTHTHTGILAIKKNEILPSATTCIDLKGIMLSEISHMILLLLEFKKHDK